MNIMNIYQGPEMLRTHPAHSGTSAVRNILPGAAADTQENTSVKHGAFHDYIMEAVNTVNGQQFDVGQLQNQFITDPDSVDIHDVTTAMAKAQMSLSLAQTVIDRLVQGWNEIQTTR